jgi:hypothetical protein
MIDTLSTQQCLDDLCRTHLALIDYVNGLTDEELAFNEAGRWNAGQQLQHVYLCLDVISKAMASKAYIEQTFGRIDREVKTYDEVLDWYRAGLANGGKAPERFEPGPFELGQMGPLAAAMNDLLARLREQIVAYTDAELDSLVLPHPFLGRMTIREMLFLMTEHPLVHRKSIERGLQQAAIRP